MAITKTGVYYEFAEPVTFKIAAPLGTPADDSNIEVLGYNLTGQELTNALQRGGGGTPKGKARGHTHFTGTLTVRVFGATKAAHDASKAKLVKSAAIGFTGISPEFDSATHWTIVDITEEGGNDSETVFTLEVERYADFNINSVAAAS